MVTFWMLILVTYNGANASTPLPPVHFKTKEACLVSAKVANAETATGSAFRGWYCVPRMQGE